MDVLILVISGMAFVGLVAAGVYLWWPTRRDPASRASVGAALLTGAVVAFAIFLLQIVLDSRLDEIEQQRANERALQDLRQQVAASEGREGTSSGLNGFDFHIGGVEDLSGFYFVNKILNEADFRGLTLNRADFSGADLTSAQLDDAKLNDADFLSARMENAFLERAELTGADLTSACLRLAHLKDANLTGADLSDVDLSDAEFNAKTVWANGETRACPEEVCVLPERRRPAASCG